MNQQHSTSWARRVALTGALAGALAGLALLSGCAAVNSLSVDVASFGDWPNGRAPGLYGFERLPSQQARADEAQLLEDAAAPALARAGFMPAPAGREPDVLVQIGARVSRTDRSPWDDPFWWGGGYRFNSGYGAWRHGPWSGPYTGGLWGGLWGRSAYYGPPRYDREVALLLRDRASGKPLFEARASTEGFQRDTAAQLAPMFAAALMDFPRNGSNPRRVTVPF
jgi:hypothetical protein